MFDWVTSATIAHFKKIQPSFKPKAQHDFGWWYNYFWNEVRGAGASDQQYQQLIDMIYTDPEVDVAGLGYAARRDALSLAAKNVLDAGPDQKIENQNSRKKRILTKLLDMGFRGMRTTAIHRNAQDTRAFFKHQIRYDAQLGGRIPMSLGFRGEGRDFNTVIQHGGARNRIDLQLLNMDKDWHPFSNPQIGNRLYFRKTSGDNCLYSVTSVGDDADLALGFPLIEDESIYDFPRGRSIKDWTSAQWKRARKPQGGKQKLVIVKLRVLYQGRMLYGYTLGTQASVYLFKVTGNAAHTQNELGGDQCRERGVRGIPMNDFLVGARLRRIHYGPTRGHGIQAQVQALKYFIGGQNWTDIATDQQIADFHFDGDIRAARILRSFVSKTFLEPDYLFGERIAPHPDLKIYEVVAWDVEFAEFHNQRRNAEIVWLGT